MATPRSTTFWHPPSDVRVATWDYADILNALEDHERGSFQQSAHLAESFGRDDRIRACLTTRIQALVGRNGLDFEIQPSERVGNPARAKKLARQVEGWWWRVLPEATLARIIRDALLLGVVICRREWRVIGGEWLPVLQPWPMQHVFWDTQLRRYRTQTSAGITTIEPTDPGWWIFEIDGPGSWMAGAVRALALPFLLRSFGWRDWARFCERHGLPILAITEPSDASKEDKDRFFKSMRRLGREGVIRLPQVDEDRGYGVEFLEAKDRSYDSFRLFLGELQTSIAIALLGQNLTTEVEGGSFAATTAHNRVRLELLDGDAERFSTGLRDGVIKPWLAYNVDGVDEEIAPWPFWDTSVPEDQSARASTMLAAGQALQTFQASGLRIDVTAYAEQFGIPLLAGEPLEEAEGDDEGDEDEEGEPDASNVVELPKAASVRLASGDAASSASGFVSGQEYADRLTSVGMRQAATAIAPDLAAVMAAIDAASTPEELRYQLERLYAEMDAAQLQGVLEKAQVMAELAGRHAVLEDL